MDNTIEKGNIRCYSFQIK